MRNPLRTHDKRQKNTNFFLAGTRHTAKRNGDVEDDNDEEVDDELIVSLPEDCNNELDDYELLRLPGCAESSGGHEPLHPSSHSAAAEHDESVSTTSDTTPQAEDQSPIESDPLTEQEVACTTSIPEQVVNPTYAALVEMHQLAMANRVSLEFIDDVLRVARKYDGFDVHKCPLRGTFLKRCRVMLQQEEEPTAPHYVKIPVPILVPVRNGSTSLFPKFSLLEQIRDLVHSKIFQMQDNLVLTDETRIESLFDKFIPSSDTALLEVHSAKWYSDTYDTVVHDPTKDWLFPLIFYMDKTGTDAMQRFSLEPVMFTTSLLKRGIREDDKAWRHLGFIPPSDDAVSSPEESMQFFHNCLGELLQELIHYQQSPPDIVFSIGGKAFKKRLILSVAFVVGDQMSQDKLCGRKAVNGGGAGHIHRGCNCSQLHASSTTNECTPVQKSKIEELITLSRETEAIQGRRGNVATTKDEPTSRAKFARTVLEKVYSMYPIVNAWNEVSFGANVNGIYRATLDDPMHYCDSGSFFYIIQVAFLSMTNSERTEMEKIVQTYFRGKRSSMREDLPRGKFTDGFSRTTLMTASEKVGSVFSLYVTLGTPEGSRLFTKVLLRVQAKYETLGDSVDKLPKITDKHFFAESSQNPLLRTPEGVRKLLMTLKQNKLGFMMDLHPFDSLQAEYFLQNIHRMLKPIEDGREPVCSLSSEEKKFADKLHGVLRKQETNKRKETTNVEVDESLSDDDDHSASETRTTVEVKKKIEKHGLIRAKNTINGASSAILTDVDGFRALLKQALCFHSFIHFFEEVEVEERLDNKKIQKHVRGFVKAFAETIYRGDDSIDCDTCKIHSHLHLSRDISDYGHPMNWDSGKGERGLKTWAKTASSTAQKQRMSEFMHQTALRISDISLLNRAEGLFVRDSKEKTVHTLEQPFWFRKKPHYVLNLSNGEMKRVPIRGRFTQVEVIPYHNKVVTLLKSIEGSNSGVKIWKDGIVKLGNGQKHFRACADYDANGAFFDWVMVQHDPDNEQSCYPAKVQMIYEDVTGKMSAIIHACSWQSMEEKRKSAKSLGTRWSLWFETNSQPKLTKIDIVSVVDILFVVEHEKEEKKNMGMNIPELRSKRCNRECCIDIIEPRYMWSFLK